MHRSVLLPLAATLLAVASVAPAPAPAAAQSRSESRDSVFGWTGRLPSGAWLRVHDAHGSIRVIETTGDRVEVRAEVRRGWADDDYVLPEFEVLRDGENVTICAFSRENGRCDEEGVSTRGRRDDRRRLAAAHFTVRLPRGLHLSVLSGNGEVTVDNAGGDVEARSGNGDVTVAGAAGSVEANSGNGAVTVLDAGGPVRAQTGNGQVRVSTAEGPVSATSGNGAITVRMARLRGDEDMQFRTGNGSITVTLPASFEGELDAHTGNGGVHTDFPIQVSGTLRRSALRGTIGRGRARIEMSSGNGSLELRRIE
jgi:hypothetical protein